MFAQRNCFSTFTYSLMYYIIIHNWHCLLFLREKMIRERKCTTWWKSISFTYINIQQQQQQHEKKKTHNDKSLKLQNINGFFFHRFLCLRVSIRMSLCVCVSVFANGTFDLFSLTKANKLTNKYIYVRAFAMLWNWYEQSFSGRIYIII